MKNVTLRELCQQTGTTRRAVQGYEKLGLVRPSGINARGHLLYDEAAQDRIRRIRKFQRFGFKVREIGKLLASPEAELQAALQRQIRVLEQQKAEKQQAIDEACALLAQMQQQNAIPSNETEETT